MWVVRTTILCQHQNGWVKWSRKTFSRIDHTLLICTDDLDWVKSQDAFKDDKYIISETRLYYDTPVMIGGGSYAKSLVPYYDLCLMSLCNGAIMANSVLYHGGVHGDRHHQIKRSLHKILGTVP